MRGNPGFGAVARDGTGALEEGGSGRHTDIVPGRDGRTSDDPRTYTEPVHEDFTDVDEAPRPVDRPRRRGRRVLAILLGLAFLAVAGMGGFALFLNSRIGDIKTDTSLLPKLDDTGDTPTDSSGEPLVTDAGENYLVVGSDARPGDTFSRSDVMVLAHVTEKKDKVYLIHFPRDLYVSIPGHGKDKLNAAFAFGGGALLAQTMQDLIGVKIDHAAKIDFQGFMDMTDAVGGVSVYAEEASDEGTFQVHVGYNDLNGAQALAFVRERHQLKEGDIGRGRRQMAFIKALMVKTLTPGVLLNPVKLTKFMNAVTDNVVVDETLTPKFMRSEALSLRNLRGNDIVFITAPFSGFGTAPNGGAIDIVDVKGMERLRVALQNDTLAGYLKGK